MGVGSRPGASVRRSDASVARGGPRVRVAGGGDHGCAGVALAGLSFWLQGQAGLKSRAPNARDDDHRRLQAKIGELLMETELLYAKVDQLEAGGPLARRRSTR